VAVVVGATQPAAAWTPGEETEIASRTPWQLFWRRFREDRVALVAAGFVGFEVLAAVFAPLIVKAVAHPPNAQYPNLLNQQYGTPTGPSWKFLFGVDSVGEDVFSRVLYGARVSLLVALVATALSVLIGVVLGLMAGYFRGPVDTLISRVIDVTLAFPVLLLALGIASACSLGNGCVRGLDDGYLVVGVRDDGQGFDESVLSTKLRDGHIGIAAHRARVESVGGRLVITSRVGAGTDAEVRVPRAAASP
jgi:N-terminal TM domain of oligopeptide transport permease C